jgi:multidrug efflux system membrane fusion protein
MRRKTIISAILGLAVVATIGALAVTHRHAFEAKAAPTPAVPTVPVVAGAVNSSDVPIYLQGVGTVIAYNTVIVRSQIQGQITKINFSEGQAVKTGDLLAVIDPRPYQAQLDQATANRSRDQAQLTNAEANLKRYTTLGNQGWATPQLVETQTAQVAQLNAAIKADEAAIEWAQTQLSYTQLTSPIDGVTGIRQIDIGNIIHPTDPNGLVVVTQLEPISVIFTLPETALPQIQQQLANGALKVEAYSQDNTNEAR